MVADGVGRFLAAAGALSDMELAVALQGLLSRRPAVWNVLYTVRCAEANISLAASATRAADISVDVAGVEAAGPRSAAVPSSGSRPADPAYRLRIGSRRLAEYYHADVVGTEHVLAAAVAMMPVASMSALGNSMHEHLVELLKKSNLAPPPPGATLGRPPRANSLSFDPQTDPLFASIEGDSKGAVEGACSNADLFAALQALPENTSGRRLLDMARYLTERTALRASGPNAEARGVGDCGAAVVHALARRLVAEQVRLDQRSSDPPEVDTDHYLAAAMHLFPEEAKRSLGVPLFSQLIALLEKSFLGPPPTTTYTFDTNFPFSEDVGPILNALEGDGGGRALIGALQELPDQTAAIQLLEIAKVFTSRADFDPD